MPHSTNGVRAVHVPPSQLVVSDTKNRLLSKLSAGYNTTPKVQESAYLSAKTAFSMQQNQTNYESKPGKESYLTSGENQNFTTDESVPVYNQSQNSNIQQANQIKSHPQPATMLIDENTHHTEHSIVNQVDDQMLFSPQFAAINSSLSRHNKNVRYSAQNHNSNNTDYRKKGKYRIQSAIVRGSNLRQNATNSRRNKSYQRYNPAINGDDYYQQNSYATVHGGSKNQGNHQDQQLSNSQAFSSLNSYVNGQPSQQAFGNNFSSDKHQHQLTGTIKVKKNLLSSTQRQHAVQKSLTIPIAFTSRSHKGKERGYYLNQDEALRNTCQLDKPTDLRKIINEHETDIFECALQTSGAKEDIRKVMRQIIKEFKKRRCFTVQKRVSKQQTGGLDLDLTSQLNQIELDGLKEVVISPKSDQNGSFSGNLNAYTPGGNLIRSQNILEVDESVDMNDRVGGKNQEENQVVESTQDMMQNILLQLHNKPVSNTSRETKKSDSPDLAVGKQHTNSDLKKVTHQPTLDSLVKEDFEQESNNPSEQVETLHSHGVVQLTKDMISQPGDPFYILPLVDEADQRRQSLNKTLSNADPRSCDPLVQDFVRTKKQISKLEGNLDAYSKQEKLWKDYNFEIFVLKDLYQACHLWMSYLNRKNLTKVWDENDQQALHRELYYVSPKTKNVFQWNKDMLKFQIDQLTDLHNQFDYMDYRYQCYADYCRQLAIMERANDAGQDVKTFAQGLGQANSACRVFFSHIAQIHGLNYNPGGSRKQEQQILALLMPPNPHVIYQSVANVPGIHQEYILKDQAQKLKIEQRKAQDTIERVKTIGLNKNKTEQTPQPMNLLSLKQQGRSVSSPAGKKPQFKEDQAPTVIPMTPHGQKKNSISSSHSITQNNQSRESHQITAGSSRQKVSNLPYNKNQAGASGASTTNIGTVTVSKAPTPGIVANRDNMSPQTFVPIQQQTQDKNIRESLNVSPKKNFNRQTSAEDYPTSVHQNSSAVRKLSHSPQKSRDRSVNHGETDDVSSPRHPHPAIAKQNSGHQPNNNNNAGITSQIPYQQNSQTPIALQTQASSSQYARLKKSLQNTKQTNIVGQSSAVATSSEQQHHHHHHHHQHQHHHQHHHQHQMEQQRYVKNKTQLSNSQHPQSLMLPAQERRPIPKQRLSSFNCNREDFQSELSFDKLNVSHFLAMKSTNATTVCQQISAQKAAKEKASSSKDLIGHLQSAGMGLDGQPIRGRRVDKVSAQDLQAQIERAKFMLAQRVEKYHEELQKEINRLNEENQELTVEKYHLM